MKAFLSLQPNLELQQDSLNVRLLPSMLNLEPHQELHQELQQSSLELKQGSFQLLPPVRLNPMLEMAEMVEIFLSSRLLAKMQDHAVNL